MDCLDDRERAWIDRSLSWVREHGPAQAGALAGQLTRLDNMAQMARSFPSLAGEAGAEVGLEGLTLVEHLCQVDSGLSSFSLPMRAIMGDAFLTAKIQLFQQLRKILREQAAPADLQGEAEREVGQSIYTILLAELLWDLVRNEELTQPTRQRAATELVRLWEAPDRLEIDDFFPSLQRVWTARHDISVEYGTMVGVTEFFQLMARDCPPVFVDYFTRTDVRVDETQAFQEFLFGLPQEELAHLRDVMQQRGLKVIDRKTAVEALKSLHPHGIQEKTAEALFASYRRRARACQYRRLLGAPGPRFTAEAYLVLHLLDPARNRAEGAASADA